MTPLQTNASGNTARGPREKAFSAQLRHAMQAQRFTPGEVGKRTAITPGAVRSYLRGTFLPRPHVQTQLQNLLQVRFNLDDPTVLVPEPMVSSAAEGTATTTATPARLTIAEAKTMLAANFGVDPSCIDIVIRG